MRVERFVLGGWEGGFEVMKQGTSSLHGFCGKAIKKSSGKTEMNDDRGKGETND